MSSPDLPPAVTLTLLEMTEPQLVADMVAAVRTAIPTWVETEASVELTLMEAWALATGQVVYALNQLPAVVLQAVLTILGVTRRAASSAVGVVAVTMASGTVGAQTLPAGSLIRLYTGGDTLDVYNPQPVTQNPTDGLTFTVPVVAVLGGTLPNGVSVGTTGNLLDALSWVESVAVSTALSGGTDSEVDAQFYPRAAAFLRRRTLTVVVPADFATSALEVAGVGRSLAIDKWNPVGIGGAPPTSPGTIPGHITIAVADPSGAATPSGVKTAVTAKLVAGAHSALTVHVIDPNVVSVTVTAACTAASGYGTTDVHDRVVAALTAYLSPGRAPWSVVPTVYDVVSVIAAVPGVAHVTAVGGSYPGSSSSTPYDLPSPTPTITVTVT